MVTVDRVPGRKEDHVVAVAKIHELQAPKPHHRGQREWTFEVSHLEKMAEKRCWHATVPYLVRQLSAFGPTRVLSQQVNQCCVSLIWMVMQGEYTEVYPGSGKKKALRPAGRGEYCISLHLSACVGVTSCERGNRS
jgi:hypothetical protein